jgi:CO/xanthine dehydrogenase Mo-binding subunit
MTEMRILDDNQTGKLVNKNLHDYKLPTALDVPSDIACVRIDPDDGEANTVGAKGLGEPVTIPTAAAIANAIYNATGIRVTQTPAGPLQLVQLFSENRKEG